VINLIKTRRFVVATVVVLGGVISSDSAAIPFEKFDQKAEVTCASTAVCSRSLRSKTTVGSHTGVVVRGGGEMTSQFSVREGDFQFEASGASLGSLTLTWDGDTYPEQLSSAGLSCFDLRQDGGSAFIIRGVSIKGSCGGSWGDESCPPFVIETRIYDSVDPTGQVYSASILRRTNGREGEDLIIPFSNFNRRGPRGEGRFSCVGAISFQIRFEPYSKVALSAGPVFTNSARPLESPPATPTPIPLPATPTPIEGTNISPVSSTPATPTAKPNSGGTISRTTSVAGEDVKRDQLESSAAVAGGTPGELLTPSKGGATPAPPIVERVIVAPLRGGNETTAESPSEEVEGVIYGEIIRK